MIVLKISNLAYKDSIMLLLIFVIIKKNYPSFIFISYDMGIQDLYMANTPQ